MVRVTLILFRCPSLRWCGCDLTAVPSARVPAESTRRPTPRGSEVLLCVRHVAVAATVTMVVLPHLGLRSRRLALLRLGLGLALRLARDTMIILGRIDQLCGSTRLAPW